LEDSKIIELYWRRSEYAIDETKRKYGHYCNSIAKDILHDSGEAEECENDTYFALWNNIPPDRPENFKGYIAAVTRNNSLERYKYRKAKKRTCELEIIRDEFFESIASNGSDPITEIEMRDAINGFLSTLSKTSRIIFLQRYWFAKSVAEIAKNTGKSLSNVKVILFRTRFDFREYLIKKGLFV